ncbi:MAG: cytidine deaminase [Candidatus Hodarchaeales archaeon]|jgi:cytidine deaminase
MEFQQIDSTDQKLIEAAKEVLQKNYHPIRHSVGAAVLCSSGKIYTGINIEACGYGPCAEPIAIGAAFTSGEREILTVVAVSKDGDEYTVLSPCGNCRQLLMDYAPDAMIIIRYEATVLKTKVQNLLPSAYISDFDNV